MAGQIKRIKYLQPNQPQSKILEVIDMMSTIDKRHGGPYDRGSADYYYWREAKPHYYLGATGSSEKVEEENMTDEQVKEYLLGYENETDRKEYT